ncbi:NAD(P)H-dependent oxidoreductase [Desulfonema magnum]|nr:NAD(P)H-dependent oxidoreductase [Desulfonema magnum]
MKIIAFNGSARKDGNTAILNQICDGETRRGGI